MKLFPMREELVELWAKLECLSHPNKTTPHLTSETSSIFLLPQHGRGSSNALVVLALAPPATWEAERLPPALVLSHAWFLSTSGHELAWSLLLCQPCPLFIFRKAGQPRCQHQCSPACVPSMLASMSGCRCRVPALSPP